jgi:SOS response regulatory protein OraA/RecX
VRATRRFPSSSDTPKDPYGLAVGWLSRRELTTMQLRARLSRAGVSADQVDAVVERLTADGRLNDARAAGVLARNAVLVKRRGSVRARRELELAGVSREAARHAVDAALDGADEVALVERVVDRRRRDLSDPREVQRLYRYLTRQGFPSSVIRAALARRTDQPIDTED